MGTSGNQKAALMTRTAFEFSVLRQRGFELSVAAGYGVHPAHLGIIFLANMQIGYITRLSA